jgi:4-amino-4-deoxy-L-arabinose transferase-like glycosyltransferase
MPEVGQRHESASDSPLPCARPGSHQRPPAVKVVPTPSLPAPTTRGGDRWAIASGALLIILAWLVLSANGLRLPAVGALLLGIMEASGSAWLDRGQAHPQGTFAHQLGVHRNRVLLILNGLALSLLARAAAGDGPQVISPLSTPLWLAGIALVVLGCWTRSGDPSSDRWKRAEIAVVVLLTLAALAVRAWSIGTMPYVLSGDEGSAGLTAWEFRTGARDNLLSIGWFSFPALYFGLLSVSQAILGRSTEAIRLVSALAGALTIPALYWTARSMFGRPAAFAAAAWLAAFHVHVFFIRLAYNNIFDGLLFVLAAGALWRGWQDGSRSAFVLAGLGLGFSQYFYTTSRLTPVVLALWLILLALRRKPDRARWAGLASAGLVAVAVFLPLGLLYAAHPDQLFFTASRVSMLVPGWTAEAAAALGMTSVGLVLEQIWVTALGLTVAELQGVYYASGVPMLVSVSGVLFLAGLLICILRCRNPRYALPLLVLAGTILLGGLSIQAPNSQRLLYMSPALALMVVLPLEEARNWSARRWPGALGAVTVLAGLLLLVMLAQNLEHLFCHYFPHEEYGSRNGAVTQAMIEIWPSLPPGVPVYFFGGGRMGFASIPSITYLRPEAQATDVSSLDQIPPGTSQLIAIVLPDEAASLAGLQTRFPEGVVARRYNRQRLPLFDLFTAGESAPTLPSVLP